MSGWILSVTAVICLTVLMDIVMPDGQMNKYVKGITSLIVVFVVVSPLTALAKGKFDFSLSGNNVETDSLMAACLDNGSMKYDELTLKSVLENLGVECSVEIKKVGGEKKAEIIISKKVLEEKDMNILITQVTDTSSKVTGIEKGNIVVKFDEREGGWK